MPSDSELLRSFHAETSHAPARTVGQPALDWSNRPVSWKRYPDLDELPLPRRFPESSVSGAAVLAGQAAASPLELDLAGLARLLFFSAGVVRRKRVAGGVVVHMRTAPSAGALFPIEVYAVCGDLPGLDAGVYHFEPVNHAVHRLHTGDWRAALAAAAADERVAAAPMSLVLTGVPWRTSWKYAARGYRHLFWDAGAIAANLVAVAEAGGMPAAVLGGFVDDAVARIVGVGEGQSPAFGGEAPLAVVPVGHAGPPAGPDAADAPAPPEPLALEVEPLSDTVIPEPLLEAAHHAGDLDDADAVARWRDAIARPRTAPATGAVEAGTPSSQATIEHILLQRGSTRRFSSAAVPAESLHWALAAATRPMRGDVTPEGRTLLDHFLVVHAVEGVDPGAYRWTPDGLDLLAAGDFRERGRFLCLDQPLGGDGGYTAFHSCELDPLLDAAGPRAYRAAHLEAGYVGARLQLAAFATGVGATGLTFYDEEVSRFFATRAAPMLAVAIGRPDYRPRPGRRPAT